MKQYKLTAWPDLPGRLQSTTSRRVVSELSQRFVSVRDVARRCGATPREVDALVGWLSEQGLVMTREAPSTISGSFAGPRGGGLMATFRGLVRAFR